MFEAIVYINVARKVLAMPKSESTPPSVPDPFSRGRERLGLMKRAGFCGVLSFVWTTVFVLHLVLAT